MLVKISSCDVDVEKKLKAKGCKTPLCNARPTSTNPTIAITIAIATSIQTTQRKKMLVQVLPTPTKPRRTTTKNTNKAQENTTRNTNQAQESTTMNNGKDEAKSTINL